MVFPSENRSGASALQFLLSIQCLRALAALAVLLHHAVGHLSPGGFDVGAAGVDVFFVISGFIMAGTVIHRTPTAGTFLWQRAVRIIPLYWAVTVAIVLLVVAFPSAFRQFTWDWDRLAASLLFIPHLDPAGQPWPLVVPGWTLNYEMFFYVLVGLALLLPERWRLPSLFGTLVGLVLAGLVLAPTHVIARTWTDARLLEFVAGGAIALWHARGRLPGPRLATALLLGSLACFAAVEEAGYGQYEWPLLLVMLPATAMVLGALALEPQLRRMRGLGPLRLLGDASYSIYLTHTLVVSAVALAIGTDRVAWYMAATLALSCGIGLACFYLFERPATRLLRDLPLRARRQVACV